MRNCSKELSTHKGSWNRFSALGICTVAKVWKREIQGLLRHWEEEPGSFPRKLCYVEEIQVKNEV